MITKTDKSGRLAILTKSQYLESGRCHTVKEQKLGWRDIKYIQTQINNHTWWLSTILGNSKDTDPIRMTKNIQEFSQQIPEMYILVKDHKPWTENSQKPCP